MTIGEQLRAIRNHHGLSLQKVEDKSGGKHMGVVVGSYERGDRKPTIEKAQELLAFYGSYRLVILHPGDVVHRADAEPGEASVQYVVDTNGARIPCRDLDEASRLASSIVGARIGYRLIGPVTFDEPEPLPVNNDRGGRS